MPFGMCHFSKTPWQPARNYTIINLIPHSTPPEVPCVTNRSEYGIIRIKDICRRFSHRRISVLGTWSLQRFTAPQSRSHAPCHDLSYCFLYSSWLDRFTAGSTNVMSNNDCTTAL